MAQQQRLSDICEFTLQEIGNRLKQHDFNPPTSIRIQIGSKWYTPICHDDEDMLFYQEIEKKDGKWVSLRFFGNILVKLQGGQFKILTFNAQTNTLNI
jgi:hypothetical protein